MFGKGNKLYGMLAMKCPKCHHGDMYKSKITEFKGVYDMHQECPHCKQEYEIEPGFFWGAMYVGYGLSSAYMLSTFALLIWGFGFSVNKSFAIAIAVGLLLVPFIARFARAIWLHMYVGFDKRTCDLVSKEIEAKKNKTDKTEVKPA